METTTTRKFQTTAEQDEAIGLFLSGEHVVIKAGAGTGKTTTLRVLSEQARGRRGQYMAFNRAIVDEAGRKMPAWVSCKTAHGLAMGAAGRPFAHRLRSRRLPSAQVAKLLGITQPVKVTIGDQAKMLAPGYLGSLVMRAIAVFCNSDDAAPGPRHIPYIEGIDMPAVDGRRTFVNNNAIAAAVEPALAKAWADLTSVDGELRYTHDCYLKLWQLSDPKIHADFVLFDEAQDASPVMASIVAQQADRAQLVYVGDSEQAIYGWRGAVDALGSIQGAQTSFLTRSFRFGPEIADVANGILERIPGAEMRLVGHDPIDSQVVDHLDHADAVLCRGNAETMKRYLDALAQEKRPYLMGEGRELVSFAKAVTQLQTEGWTPHPELSIFSTWGQVQDYVDQDPQGSELALLVRLVDEYGADVIVEALENQLPEDRCDFTISTAHKAKGREWDTVTLAGDFPEPDEDDEVSAEELRLLYVAVTRARNVLDLGAVGSLADYLPEPDPAAP
jgi:hypothetical protein